MDHFVIKDHRRETRNRGCLINLPTIKLEYARRGFYFMGAKLYNELPLNIRSATSFANIYIYIYIYIYIHIIIISIIITVLRIVSF